MKARLPRQPVEIALCLIGIMALCAPPVRAQSGLQIAPTLVDDAEFPAVTVYLTVADAAGLPVADIPPDSFSAAEDGDPIPELQAEYRETDQPVAVALVFDLSGSMLNDNALQNSIAAAGQFIDRLGPNDVVALITFAEKAQTVLEFTDDLESVRAALGSLTAAPDAPTALYDGIFAASQLLDTRPAGRKAIVVLTDGQDTASALTFDDIVTVARTSNIPIYPVAFGFVDDEKLGRLATLTGGLTQIQQDSTRLEEGFSTLLALFHRQYMITFNSLLDADGREHELNITLAYQEVSQETKLTFTARPREIAVSLPDMADGQTVGGLVTLKPEIAAPTNVTQVEYLLDGKLIAAVSKPPFEYQWDASEVKAGDYTLTVKAADESANVGETEVNITVRPALILSLTAPKADDVIRGPVSVRAEVDSLARVARVDFFADGKLIASDSDPPYEVKWDPKDAPTGGNVISARAVDVAGQESNEESVPVIVDLRSNGALIVAAAALAFTVIVIVPLALRKRRAVTTVAPAAADINPLQRASQIQPAVSTAGNSTTGDSTASVSTAWLVATAGAAVGERFPLAAAEIRLGRNRASNDIHVEGAAASRQHAVIRQMNGGHVLSDLNPANPSSVNGQPLEDERWLVEGDEIEIGDSRFRYTRIAS